jgi:hypothetical protein
VYYAFRYAPGKNLYRVEIGGIKEEEEDAINLYLYGPTDKFVGKTRKYLAHIDASPILEKYTRQLLLKILDKQNLHKFNVNADIKAYLETGLETEHTLKHLTSLDSTNKYERNFIDLVNRCIQCQLTTNGFSKMYTLQHLFSDLIYWEGITQEDFHENLNKVFLEAMNLSE